MNELNENYTDEYVKIMDDTVDGYRKRYGGGIEFNRIYTYVQIICEFIERVKPVGEPKISLLPGKKVKNILFTKKRYLQKQKEYIDKLKE